MTASYYIHIPFCLSKCRYCAFNSAPAPSGGEMDRYCRALEREIRDSTSRQASMQESAIRYLETVYFGGGTPTVLQTGKVVRLLETALESAGGPGRPAEVTIEANPETVDLQILKSLRSAGFNRLSLGAQSFDDGALRLLGRAHSAKKTLLAFENARRAGFDNIGIDLIYGLPGQDMEKWREDLTQTIGLGPEHVSAYSLTYEPGSEFTAWRDSGRIFACDEDLEAEMLLAARETLGQAGFHHYEVSNFAKPGFQCRHNLNYWRCGDYLGFGAGAHSHLGGRRWSNAAPYAEYIDKINTSGSASCFEEFLTREQRLFEAVFLGLRMTEGIVSSEFISTWGMAPLEYKPEVWHSLEEEGYLAAENGRLRLTEKGMLLADSCTARFAP